MGYADLDAAQIDLGVSIADTDDATKITRLAQLDDEISRVIDQKTGRMFGSPATSRAVVVNGPYVGGEVILLLPEPVRSVTSIVITGDNAETLDAIDYVLWHGTRYGDYHAIKRVDGSGWPIHDGDNVITVTGQWSDDSDGADVPDEIIAAATFLVVEEWRLRQSSPAGEIGPDGLTIRPRNPWNYELVKSAIEKYGGAKPVVSF